MRESVLANALFPCERMPRPLRGAHLSSRARHLYDVAMDISEMVACVRGIGAGVVSTLATDGSPQAARLDLTATDRGELVFNARSESRKI